MYAFRNGEFVFVEDKPTAQWIDEIASDLTTQGDPDEMVTFAPVREDGEMVEVVYPDLRDEEA